MKITSSKDFLPLAISGIAVAAFSQTETFKYNDFVQNNIEFRNEFTRNHLNRTAESTYSDLLIKYKFQNHLKQWKSKTRFISSPIKIVEDEDFKKIVKIGEPVVKFIIQELKEEPSYLVWALNIIYGFKISEDPSTTIPEASRMWIRYLKA